MPPRAARSWEVMSVRRSGLLGSLWAVAWQPWRTESRERGRGLFMRGAAFRSDAGDAVD
jgi:hypothetical protein